MAANDKPRGDTRAHYERIAEKNREQFQRLIELASKSPWSKHYRIRPRRLTVLLLGGYRGAVGRRDVTPEEYAKRIRQITRAALSGESTDAVVATAVERAIHEARRLTGLLDDSRRGSYPNPELTGSEHAEIETILRDWLFDSLSEFGPENIP